MYFALLTIAFAEFTRILFDHFGWVGAASGLFLPVTNAAPLDLLNLRGAPGIFYYCMLALTLGSLALGQMLLSRRIGFYWRAIREDQIAAEALGINIFRYKIMAVALSAAMTAIGGAFLAFYDNNLYPDTAFSTARSVEMIVAPIVGGIGHLFGPILGAFVLTALGERTTRAAELFGVNGLKQLLYGDLADHGGGCSRKAFGPGSSCEWGWGFARRERAAARRRGSHQALPAGLLAVSR